MLLGESARFAPHRSKLTQWKRPAVRLDPGSKENRRKAHGRIGRGSGGNGTSAIGALARDFDLIAPDMRGCGDSEKPDLRDISKFHLDVITDDHAKLLHHLGIGRAYNGWARLFRPGHAQVRPPLS
jgi:hypothetical protein